MGNNKLRKFIREKIELDIEIGDELLGGRFKNKKTIVKDIGKDEKNQPTVNGKTLLKFRIKKIIKEELNKLFESFEFQNCAMEQMAANMSQFKLPRRGMDDSINNFNQIQFDLKKRETDEEKKEEFNSRLNAPALNAQNVDAPSNIFESEEVDESYGIYGSTAAIQKNLDFDGGIPPKTANFGKDAQEEFDLYNNNIDRELKQTTIN